MNAPFLRPMGCPAGVDPVRWRKAVVDRVEQLQDAMLRLIAALDQMDGDCDREPSLAGFGATTTDDREGGDPLDEGEPNDWDGEDSDADEDSGDDEPYLGTSIPGGMGALQSGWSYDAFGFGSDADA